MLKTRHYMMIFIPAILFVLLAFLIRIVQFVPLYPTIDQEALANSENGIVVPIFEGDPIVGSKSASKTIIVFEDLGCESCKIFDETTNALLEKYPEQIKFIWKLLPVTNYPQSTQLAHEYAFCANKQKLFSDFKDYAFANSDNLSETTLKSISVEIELNQKKLDDCLSSFDPQSYIENTKELAKFLNIQAVPTFFYNNNQITAPETVLGWEVLLGLSL